MPNILYLSLSLSLLEYPTYFAYDTEHIDRHGMLMLMCGCADIYVCYVWRLCRVWLAYRFGDTS